MAVLKKIRERWWRPEPVVDAELLHPGLPTANWDPPLGDFDVRIMTAAHLDEVWRLDQRCFVDGEAYSRDTFEFLLTSPDSLSYRAVLPGGGMIGFIVGVMEPDHTGHITTVGVAPEHRRRGIGNHMLAKMEISFKRRGARIVRLEVRSVNLAAQKLYHAAGYTVTQRLTRYYANGGDGLLMVKSLE
jgi:ribosomal-protein-alanine N-acetyltransferase